MSKAQILIETDSEEERADNWASDYCKGGIGNAKIIILIKNNASNLEVDGQMSQNRLIGQAIF